MGRRIGIFGGSFNPPHLGHVYIAEEARCRLKLDEVWVLPVAQQPLKANAAMASSADRLAMCNLMWKGMPGYRLVAAEMRRGGKSYSYETIKEFRRRYPKDSFFFLAGVDCLRQLHQWRCLRAFVESCRLILLARPGWQWSDNHQARALMGPRLYAKMRKSCLFIPGFDVSSTVIRKKAKTGSEVFHLVGRPVASYIRKHRLYRS